AWMVIGREGRCNQESSSSVTWALVANALNWSAAKIKLQTGRKSISLCQEKSKKRGFTVNGERTMERNFVIHLAGKKRTSPGEKENVKPQICRWKWSRMTFQRYSVICTLPCSNNKLP